MSEAKNVETSPATIGSVVKHFVMWFLPTPKPKPRKPMAGESWIMKNKTPWPEPNVEPVKILDVKGDWVRYAMTSIFTDERMEMSSFLHIYQPYDT